MSLKDRTSARDACRTPLDPPNPVSIPYGFSFHVLVLSFGGLLDGVSPGVAVDVITVILFGLGARYVA